MEEKKEPKWTQNQIALITMIQNLALSYAPNATPIPEGAYRFWFEAVEKATLNEIREAVSEWSKTSSRMMMPADLYKLLQAKRAIKREAQIAEESKQDHQPLPANVAAEYMKAIKRAEKNNVPSDAWARRLMIKEAYGFSMTPFVKESWRKALNKDSQYSFEDTNGVFPLDQFPDERTSFYHDCQCLFGPDYEAKHGLKLVYDKELAHKKYMNSPKAYKREGGVDVGVFI